MHFFSLPTAGLQPLFASFHACCKINAFTSHDPMGLLLTTKPSCNSRRFREDIVEKDGVL